MVPGGRRVPRAVAVRRGRPVGRRERAERPEPSTAIGHLELSTPEDPVISSSFWFVAPVFLECCRRRGGASGVSAPGLGTGAGARSAAGAAGPRARADVHLPGGAGAGGDVLQVGGDAAVDEPDRPVTVAVVEAFEQAVYQAHDVPPRCGAISGFVRLLPGPSVLKRAIAAFSRRQGSRRQEPGGQEPGGKDPGGEDQGAGERPPSRLMPTPVR
ncbi:hypothetical protein Franean1_1991 [Parafrankia sp. EAN1pec]|nr:hypothetical protein Franean1_1991 [Frankia sp. EAN1pec]